MRVSRNSPRLALGNQGDGGRAIHLVELGDLRWIYFSGRIGGGFSHFTFHSGWEAAPVPNPQSRVPCADCQGINPWPTGSPSAYRFSSFAFSLFSFAPCHLLYTPPMPRGFFITFEGGEGSGKSTQIQRLADALRKSGREVIVTREPGGTPIAEAVRAILLDPQFDPDGVVEVFLYEAARRDHVTKVINPAVERGAVVLSDRFADSSLVYQGVARGVGWDEVVRLNTLATGGMEPDLTIVFDLQAQVGLDRARGRNSATDSSESRLDEEPVEFHERVREGFALLAERFPHRIRVIDADGDPDQVYDRLQSVLPKELV